MINNTGLTLEAMSNQVTAPPPKEKKNIQIGDVLFMFELEQRTPEWHKARKGMITASNASKIITSPYTSTGKVASGSKIFNDDLKKGLSKGAITYSKKLASAHFKVSDDNYPKFISSDMQWGIDNEPFAKEAFFQKNGINFEEVGFVKRINSINGCSPDGVNIDILQGLEIKCPNDTTHLDYLQDNSILLNDHLHQVQWSMFVTGFEIWHLVSYHPSYEKKYQLVTLEIEKDEALHNLFDEKSFMIQKQIKEEINKVLSK